MFFHQCRWKCNYISSVASCDVEIVFYFNVDRTRDSPSRAVALPRDLGSWQKLFESSLHPSASPSSLVENGEIIRERESSIAMKNHSILFTTYLKAQFFHSRNYVYRVDARHDSMAVTTNLKRYYIFKQ